MKYLSLFSGIGGFEVGIQQAYELQRLCIENQGQSEGSSPRDSQGQRGEQSNDGSEGLACVGYSEIDKYAISIYERHFPDHKNYGDITKIDASTLPEFDLVVGGFPCQSFSIAGKRGGFEDVRGTLFFDIARLLKERKPRLCLLENVKGLLSHEGGKTFATIIATLDELGYDLQWQVLNSKDFGVPQNRERVLIVGHLRGTSRPEVFPFIGGSITSPSRDGTKILHENISGNLATRDTATSLRTGASKNYQTVVEPNGQNIQSEGNSPESQCESGPETHSIRRLTPTECERLQGFADGWTEGVSDTQRYKCLGNAVTVNVIRAIITQLRDV